MVGSTRKRTFGCLRGTGRYPFSFTTADGPRPVSVRPNSGIDDVGPAARMDDARMRPQQQTKRVISRGSDMADTVLPADGAAKIEPADANDLQTDGTSVDAMVVGVAAGDPGAETGVGGPGLARSAESGGAAATAPRAGGLTDSGGSATLSAGNVKPDASAIAAVAGI